MNSRSTENFDKLLIGGDLSGIQKFLYNITSKNAAVSLKGRSHYLRQYMEDTCDELITRLNVEAHAVAESIYSSGGKFYIICSFSEDVIGTLACFYKEKQFAIWKEHRGGLAINFGHIPFSENDDGTVNVEGLAQQKPSILWKRITEDFARQKNRKFLNVLEQSYEDFFEVTPVCAKSRVCTLTGIESDDCVKLGDGYVLPSVAEQIKIGEGLRNKEGFKTFEDYAGNSKLGILRMDVDGLGKLFASGFNTITEYKDISAYLDRYFTSRPEKGYVSNLQALQQQPDFKEDLNILYAGGDDIFVVGRWDKVIDFADEVRKDFAAYAQDKGLSISGGVAIVSPKFPIAKAAELAGEAEDIAKGYIFKDNTGKEYTKNAFCMFGQPISWQQEFDYVKEYKDAFLENHEKGLPKGFLHKIICYSQMAENSKRQKEMGETPNYAYVWHSSYYITRVIERIKGNDSVVAFCKKLRDQELYGINSADKFRLIALAARWAELTLRFTNPKQ